MKRYALKLSALLLAGLMASGVASAEVNKYFECKITTKFGSMYENDRCGGKGQSPCNQIEKIDFSKFTAVGNQYIYRPNVSGGTEEESISRVNGDYSYMLLRSNPFDVLIQKQGTCELKTETLKLKF